MPTTSAPSTSPALARTTSSPADNVSNTLPAPTTKTTAAAKLAASRTNGKGAPAKAKETDPAVYADLVQARINALEGVESAEDQAEKKSGE